MIENAKSSQSTFSLIPKNVSDCLQMLLLITYITYVLGYVVWSLYAWQCSLGFLPILKEQYLIAGIIPMLLLVTLIGPLIVFHFKYQRPVILENKKFGWPNIRFVIWNVFNIALCAYYYDNSPSFLKYVFYLVILTFSVQLLYGLFRFLLVRKENGIGRVDAFVLRIITSIQLSCCTVFLVVLYSWTIFYKIPSEFGGPKSNVVILILKRNFLSVNAYNILKGSKAQSDTTSIFDTKVVRLLSMGDDFIYVRDGLNVMKIKKEAVMGIFLRGFLSDSSLFRPREYDETLDFIMERNDEVVKRNNSPLHY